ncbi:MAG: hypothetical protein QOJ34_1977 [Pseudonocardiales bacterium]|nr:hypothetical protein [Pseudonocardiales bacterium]
MTYQGPPGWEPPRPYTDTQAASEYTVPQGDPPIRWSPAGYSVRPEHGHPHHPSVCRPLAPRARPWNGGVLAAAGLATILGSFLRWVTVDVGTLHPVGLAGTDAGLGGEGSAFFGAVMLALGVVILARQGRLWVGIVGVVVGSLITLAALNRLSDFNDVGKVIGVFGVAVDVGPGLILVLLGGLAGVAASIVAIAVRR